MKSNSYAGYGVTVACHSAKHIVHAMAGLGICVDADYLGYAAPAERLFSAIFFTRKNLWSRASPGMHKSKIQAELAKTLFSSYRIHAPAGYIFP